MPASRNSSKSWLNFPEAAASWLLDPREEWTTSPAEWLSSAAVWFRSLWASWNALLQGGSFKDKTSINSSTLQKSEGNNPFTSFCAVQVFLWKCKSTECQEKVRWDSQCPPAVSCWPRQCFGGPCQHLSGLAGNSHNYSGSATLLWPPETQHSARSMDCLFIILTMWYTTQSPRAKL